MPYIGNTIRAADDYRLIDDISSGFNGSATSFALQVAGSAPVPFPKSPQQVLISVNGVIQEPDPTGASGFNLVGTNIVFSSAPTNGHAFFGIIYATADYLNAGGNFPAGSLGAPSFTFIGDENTGIYRKGSGSIGFVADATEIANTDSNGITISSGNLIIPDSIIHNGDTNTKIRFPSADTVTIETAGSERFRIDSGGDTAFSGSIQISDIIQHEGDTDTRIRFPDTDEISFETGGAERFKITDSESVFNDGSASYDFRVEGGTEANLLFIDGSADKIGIGTSSPSGARLHLVGSGNTGIKVQVGSSSADQIYLGNTGGASSVGTLTNVGFNLIQNGGSALSVNTSKDIGINTTSPADKLNVSIDTDGEGITISSANLKPMFTGNSNRAAENNTVVGFSGKWNGTEVGRIAVEAGPDTTNKDDGSLTFFTRTSGSGLTKRLSIEENGDVLPGADSLYDIGSNSNRFANGYFDTLYGDGSNLTGITTAISSIAGDASQRVIVSDGDGTATCSNQFVFDGNKLQLLGTNNSRAFEINPGGNAGTMVLDRNGFLTSMIRASDGGSNVAGSSGGGSRLHLAKTSINFDTFPHVSNIGDAVTYTTRASIDTSGNFVPGANNSYSLGTSSLRWSNLFVNDINMSNKGKQNEVDGTWGDYTIQEGHEDLFLINHRTGKKFKFNLTEVG